MFIAATARLLLSLTFALLLYLNWTPFPSLFTTAKLLNCTSIAISLTDKLIATNVIPYRTRVPELLFLLLALIGSLPGLVLSFYLFSHKTRKTSFHLKLLLSLLFRLIFYNTFL